MSKFKSFGYNPCALEATDIYGVEHIQVVLEECAEFFSVWGYVEDPLTCILFQEHICDVDTKEDAEALVNLLTRLLTGI